MLARCLLQLLGAQALWACRELPGASDSVASSLAASAMLDADTDLHRLMHRLSGVEAVQRSWQYRLVEQLEMLGATTPPNPWDSTVTKRTWEKSMMCWRTELNDILVSPRAQARTASSMAPAAAPLAETASASAQREQPQFPPTPGAPKRCRV